MTLANPRTDARASVRTMAEGVEGVAFLAPSAASNHLIAELAGARAVVTVARGRVPGVHAVFAANREAAAQLTSHLIETGRRRTLFIGTPEQGSDLHHRHLGYLDALVCGNDLLALAIMLRLTDAGVRVPEDVAVTGWDDLHAARYARPGLTTVAQPSRDLARTAVLALHAQRLSQHDALPEAQVLDSQVVHRQSCCSPGPTPTHRAHQVKEKRP